MIDHNMVYYFFIAPIGLACMFSPVKEAVEETSGAAMGPMLWDQIEFNVPNHPTTPGILWMDFHQDKHIGMEQRQKYSHKFKHETSKN